KVRKSKQCVPLECRMAGPEEFSTNRAPLQLARSYALQILLSHIEKVPAGGGLQRCTHLVIAGDIVGDRITCNGRERGPRPGIRYLIRKRSFKEHRSNSPCPERLDNFPGLLGGVHPWLKIFVPGRALR